MTPKPERRLDMIDGLRGLAIFAVIYQHVYAYPLANKIAATGLIAWPYGFTNAWLGVSLFFVLSGFVLGLPYAEGRRDIRSGHDTMAFLGHRAKRLLPLFLIVCLVGYLIKLHMTVIYLPSLVLALSTMNMFTLGEFFPLVNNVYWSLSIEIWFSILFPVLLVCMRRFGLIRTLVVVAVLALGVRFAGTFLTYFNPHINPVKDSVLARLDDFMLGIVLANLYVAGKLKRAPQWLVLAGVVLVYASSVGWDAMVFKWAPYQYAALLNIATSCGFAMIIAGCLAEGSFAARMVSVLPLRLAGAMCFSLYSWHFLLVDKFITAEPFSLRNNVAYWSVLIVLSCASYRFIEFPNASWRTLLRLRPKGPVVELPKAGRAGEAQSVQDA